MVLSVAASCALCVQAEPGSIEAPSAEPRTSLESSVERRVVLMGTTARIVVSGSSRKEALAATVVIEGILRSAEDGLSTWKTGTELDRLNRTEPGEEVRLSAAVDEELSRALDCAAKTEGAFDPTVGALTEAWDLRGEGRYPRDGELEAARNRSGWQLLSHQDGAWTRHRDLLVDEGGFGKGAALDRVRTWLSTSTPRRALVDLGGQLLLFDSWGGEESWQVAVSDPEDRSRPLLNLALPSGSVATSGNSERASGTDGTIGHLLDPRTGKPAADFGSLTVWAPTALEADCLATGLFVAGPDTALAFADQHPGIEVLVVERQGSERVVRASDGLHGRIEGGLPAEVPDPPHVAASLSHRW